MIGLEDIGFGYSGPLQATFIEIDPAQAESYQRLLRDFRDQAPSALNRAINRTLNHAKSVTLTRITSRLAVKRKDIDIKPGQKGHRFGGVTIRRATRDRPYGTLNIIGAEVVFGQATGRTQQKLIAGRIPIYRFDPWPREPRSRSAESARRRRGRRPGKGVSYRILREGPRKRLPHAFIARFASGHIGVFMRLSAILRSFMPAGLEEAEIRRRIAERLGGRTAAGRKRDPIIELFGPSMPHVAIEYPELMNFYDTEMRDYFFRQIDSQYRRIEAERLAGMGGYLK